MGLLGGFKAKLQLATNKVKNVKNNDSTSSVTSLKFKTFSEFDLPQSTHYHTVLRNISVEDDKQKNVQGNGLFKTKSEFHSETALNKLRNDIANSRKETAEAKSKDELLNSKEKSKSDLQKKIKTEQPKPEPKTKDKAKSTKELQKKTKAETKIKTEQTKIKTEQTKIKTEQSKLEDGTTSGAKSKNKSKAEKKSKTKTKETKSKIKEEKKSKNKKEETKTIEVIEATSKINSGNIKMENQVYEFIQNPQSNRSISKEPKQAPKTNFNNPNYSQQAANIFFDDDEEDDNNTNDGQIEIGNYGGNQLLTDDNISHGSSVDC